MDGTHDDNAEEQADRRVEVLFFAPGQEPDIALLDEDPKVSELYHPDAFQRVEMPSRPGGAKGHWTVTVAYPEGAGRTLILRSEAGNYEQSQTGSDLFTFEDVPAGNFLSICDAESKLPVSSRLLLGSMLKTSELTTELCVREEDDENPRDLSFLNYPLEEMTYGS